MRRLTIAESNDEPSSHKNSTALRSTEFVPIELFGNTEDDYDDDEKYYRELGLIKIY